MTVLPIRDAAHWTRVPAGTIRRWLAEGRIIRHGQRRPWRVDADEVQQLRDTMRVRLRERGT